MVPYQYRALLYYANGEGEGRDGQQGTPLTPVWEKRRRNSQWSMQKGRPDWKKGTSPHE